MDSFTRLAREMLGFIAETLQCEPAAIPERAVDAAANVYRKICAEKGFSAQSTERYIEVLRREYAALKTPAPSGEATPSASLPAPSASLEASSATASSAVDAAAALAAMQSAQEALSTAQNAIATERDHALQALRATGSASFDGVIKAIDGALQACEAVQRRAADLVACAFASNDN